MRTVEMDVQEFQLYIGGRSVSAASGATYESMNPYTGKPWALVPEADIADVDHAVAAAQAALDGEWGAMSGFARAALLRRLADLIPQHAERLARFEVADAGKLYREMIGQLNAVSAWYYYYAGLADKIEGRTIPVASPEYMVYTRREPVGVVAGITAWNSPLLMVASKLAPALAAGCTFIVKPSEHSPTSSLAFAQIFDQAGFPPGVFNVVTGSTGAVGTALVGHHGVDKVTFTGSPAVGRAVASAAGQNLTAVSLELGGKSPQVVFDDADLEAVANGVTAGIFAAGGQTCVAGSRLIVQRSVERELIERIVERASKIRLGDPNDPETEMGPIANAGQYERVLHYLQVAQDEGATVALGGGPDTSLGGFFVRPTVLTGLKPDATVVREEIFGPVLSTLTFTDECEAGETGERYRVRPGRGYLDEGRPSGPSGRRPVASRDGLGQRLSRRWPQRPVRRVQRERHRARERYRGPRRVLADEVGVGRADRRDPGPVRDGAGELGGDARCGA
jgi:acyl-CoA reductase-like NAD-dependent aldehyde dehydrogenase